MRSNAARPIHATFESSASVAHIALRVSRAKIMSPTAPLRLRLLSEPRAYSGLASERVNYPSKLRWTCIRCTNSCRDVPRRKRKILLTGRDVERIAMATRHDQEQFSYAVDGHSPYERRMRMVRGSCLFLEGCKCSIYRIRPLICRFYPFSLTPSMDGGFRIKFDPACSGIGRGLARDERFFSSLARLARRELSQ